MMPTIQTTIRSFQQSMQFAIVVKTPTDGMIVETSQTPVALWFEGHVQPLHPKSVAVKPEGQRKFKWWELFTDLNNLELDSIIKDIRGKTYRVMSSHDLSLPID